MYNEATVSCHLSEDFAIDFFPFADGFEIFNSLGVYQESASLLVFGNPDFERRQRRIAEFYSPELDFASGFFDKLLKNIGRPARSLIVDADDRIVITHFDASPDDAVHLLFHFCIATLDSIKIKLFFILAL